MLALLTYLGRHLVCARALCHTHHDVPRRTRLPPPGTSTDRLSLAEQLGRVAHRDPFPSLNGPLTIGARAVIGRDRSWEPAARVESGAAARSRERGGYATGQLPSPELARSRTARQRAAPTPDTRPPPGSAGELPRPGETPRDRPARATPVCLDAEWSTALRSRQRSPLAGRVKGAHRAQTTRGGEARFDTPGHRLPRR